MLLATCNSQGELSPLEIGIHALQAVGKAKAGRGKKGGLSEYARLLSKDKSYLSQLVAAAEVAKSLAQVNDLATLRDKAKHLAAIHDLPPGLWAGAVETLGDRSVVEIEAAVKKAKEFLHQHGITREWVDYLPPSEVEDVLLFPTWIVRTVKINTFYLPCLKLPATRGLRQGEPARRDDRRAVSGRDRAT